MFSRYIMTYCHFRLQIVTTRDSDTGGPRRVRLIWVRSLRRKEVIVERHA